MNLIFDTFLVVIAKTCFFCVGKGDKSASGKQRSASRREQAEL
jgi:hypothetical protein